MQIEHLNKLQIPTKPSGNVLDKTLLLNLDFKKLGISRKVSKDLVKAEGANPNFYNTTKKLFESKAYSDIEKHYRTLQKNLRKPGVSIPFPLKKGVYLVPTSNNEEADNLVSTAIAELPALVDLFVAEYDTVVNSAKTELGPLYKADQYPPKELVKFTFAINKNYLSFNDLTKLKEVNPALYQKEFDRIKDDVVSIAVSIQNDIRTAFADLVSHMMEKLQMEDDGRPKRFKAASLNKLKEFIDAFKHLNVTDDNDLAKLVEQAKNLTEGISTESIKDDQTIRERVTSGLEALKGNLDSMLENVPTRRFKMFDLGTEAAEN